MSQQLTVKQQTLSNQISKVGDLKEISFARKTVEFTKMKELESQSISDGLALIFVKVANYAGIKEPISEINKQDIKELLLNRFSSLSLEEIEYAFKLDRYGVFGEPTKHFYLINSEYVSQVLNKYKAWLTKIRIDNDLSISKPVISESNVSESEKIELIKSGVEKCYNHYIEFDTIPDGYLYVYDVFYDLGYLTTDTKEKKKIYDLAKSRVRRKYEAIKPVTYSEKIELKNTISKIKNGNDINEYRIEAKKISLMMFLGSVRDSKKEINDFL